MDVVTHLLALISEHRIFAILQIAAYQVAQKPVQLDAVTVQMANPEIVPGTAPYYRDGWCPPIYKMDADAVTPDILKGITAIGTDGKPYGITIGSFVAVSLDPALVGFLPGLNSHSWQAIAASGSLWAR